MPSALLWVFLVVGVLAGIAVLAYWLADSEVEDETAEDSVDPLGVTASEAHLKDPLATTTEEYRGAARKSRMIALKQSLERSLDSREGVARGSAKDRMVMPWFMLVGADGSGKKTILANNGLDLPWGPPIEVDSQRKDAGKWWLFEDAVVLEAPDTAPGTTEGSSTLPPDQTVVDSSIGWSTLLHMLRRERPDSPLNGIIVTISCADLVGARSNAEKMEDQANRIRTFLERTRRFLGVRLPLHVIVTKCDALPGFRSFANALPEGRRNDVFGWANPNHPEAKFEPTWVDAGFVEIETQLARLRDEVLAAPEQVRDSVGVFVFDSEFGDLQEPLKAFVARLMPIGERQPSLFLRGFYFTGDVIDAATVRARKDVTLAEQGRKRTPARTSEEIAGEPHNMVFLKSLFAERIFKEAGLARPAARLRLSRDRRVVLAQAAALLIAVGGGLGLWNSVNGLHAADRPGSAGLKADAELLTRVLSGVAIDLDELRRGDTMSVASPRARRSRDAAVIELVGQMRTVPSVDVRSAFIPSSWFSRLPGELRASMMVSVRDIVLPVTRQRLMERASRLIGSAGTGAIPEELDSTDPRSVVRYLTEVRTLSSNIARYNALADSTTGTFEDLSALLDYLFGERIAKDTSLATPDFEEALRSAVAPPIVVSGDMASSVVRGAVSVISGVANRAGRQLAPRASVAAERAIQPADDLAALEGLGGLVGLMDDAKGIVATVGDSVILGTNLARGLRDSIAAYLEVAAVRVAPDTLAPDSSARRLRNVIADLHGSRLMRPVDGRTVTSDIRPGDRLRWDVGSLESALSLQGEFLQAVVTTAAAFPGQSPERLRRALEIQLRRHAVHSAASAQRFTSLADVDEPIAEIRALGLNLEGAALRMLRVASMLDSLGAHDEGQRLLTAGARQAEQALALAQATFDRRRYLSPTAATISTWQGVLPFAFVAMGTSDSLNFSATLIRQENDVRSLAHAVAPSLRYLRLSLVADSVRANALLESWEDILTAVLKYERGDLTSSMGQLHRYLASDLMIGNMDACRLFAARPDAIEPSNDVFIIRRRQLRSALVGRCLPGGSADAVASYQRLRAYFETRLAGRYPFADTATEARVDAVVSDVRDFVRQYDAFAVTGEPALRSDPRQAQTSRQAMAFLDQFAEARAFLAPFAEASAPRTMPAYGLTVSAKTLTDSLPLAIVEVRAGVRTVGLDDAPQSFWWTADESLSLELTPLDSATSRTLASATGPWSALRFAQRPGGVSVKLIHPDTRMEIAMPVFPRTAPSIVILRGR